MKRGQYVGAYQSAGVEVMAVHLPANYSLDAVRLTLNIPGVSGGSTVYMSREQARELAKAIENQANPFV